MSNGQPRGPHKQKTTENGAYNLLQLKARRGFAVPRNTVNPNTGVVPGYFLTMENKWYKAAHFNPALNVNVGGYTLYSTNSDSTPTNTPDGSRNAANLLYQGKLAVTQ